MRLSNFIEIVFYAGIINIHAFRYATEKTETLYCLNSYQRGFGFLVGTPDEAKYERESIAGWAFVGGEVVT